MVLNCFIMVPALRSLREQNIQTACKETPADDEELTRRMELTKAKYHVITLKIFSRYPFNHEFCLFFRNLSEICYITKYKQSYYDSECYKL